MTRLEGLVNWLSTAGAQLRPFNPLYHLGPLAIFLLIVLTVTGIYLTVLYRPGTERAYETVLGISATWLGSLMRSVHRYAADGLILVTLLHAVKMLFSDRFWGNRWLAWVSGWALLILFWIIGIMGYWLVWDAGAQWLTEFAISFVDGPFALSFLGANVASATFALFVIVLFLHVFLPILLVVGIIIHVLRLARARYWAPRWLMLIGVGALVVLALLRPVSIGVPADFSRLVGTVELDWWYMGFLPFISSLGGPLFWGVQIVVLVVMVALPWLWRGRHDGPAVVLPGNCTGCAVCARECPFNAIEMIHRDDASPYSSIALVSPHMCTGCGICVGACPDKAIELESLHSAVLRQDLQRNLAQASATGERPVTVYACERHAALGTLPPLEDARPLETGVGGTIPLLRAKLPPRVNVGAWPDDEGRTHPVITAVVPCTGMIHPNWAAEAIEAGAAGTIVVSCPAGDCSHREGIFWIADRLKRRRTFRRGNTHFLELAPGNRDAVTSLWTRMVGDGEAAAEAPTRVGKALATTSQEARLTWRNLLVGFALLLVTLGLAILPNAPASQERPADGMMRVAVHHGGELIAAADNLPPEIVEKLPPNVDPAQVLGGERFPVSVRMIVDGEEVLNETYEPGGLRNEGAAYGLSRYWLAPGEYHVQLLLMDDGETWQQVFDDVVQVSEEETVTFYFDEQEGIFQVDEGVSSDQGE